MKLRNILLAACAVGVFGLGATPAVMGAAAPAKTDFTSAVAALQLVESAKPVREMAKGWKKPTKIVVIVNDPKRVAWFQEVAPGVKLVYARNEAEALPLIGDADAQLGGFCNTDLLKAGKALHWVHANHAGVDECYGEHEPPPELVSGNIVMTNQKRTFGPVIAEHAVALMLGLSRGLDLYIRMDVNEKFNRAPGAIPKGKMRQIYGKTMLIVGLGGIGTDVAKLAHGMGMRVIATRNSSHEGPDYVEYVGLSTELPTLIGQADVVVDALPLVQDTVGYFNKAVFDKMKKGALFINVGRGKTVATDDLIAALQSGQVGGAGLDVTNPDDHSRLPDGHPLFRAPNVIITPHTAASADEAGSQGEEPYLIMKENLRRYVAGEKLYSVVDPRLGY